jgi:hypothetical protein
LICEVKYAVTKESIIDPDLIGMKISPNPSLPKRGISPFCEACLPVGREGRRDLVSSVYTINEPKRILKYS